MSTVLEGYLESIVRKVSNGEGLHECRSICQAEHHCGSCNLLCSCAMVGGGIAHSPDAQVCKGMVEQEIGMSHEVQCDGDLKEAQLSNLQC